MAKFWLSTPPMGWSSQIPGLHLGNKIFLYLLTAIGLYLLSDNVFAADISTILGNLRRIINPITAMVCAISFVSGTFMIFKALIMLKKFGTIGMQQQTQGGEALGPIVHLIVGAVLIYIPTSTDIMMDSLFDTTRSMFSPAGVINYANLGAGASLLGYVTGGNLEAQWADLANTLVLYIQFIGFLSFIKGWFMLSKAGSQGNQPGHTTKGVVHIIGGVIAINVVQTFDILRNTILYGT